jgi:hypothetical protein
VGHVGWKLECSKNILTGDNPLGKGDHVIPSINLSEYLIDSGKIRFNYCKVLYDSKTECLKLDLKEFFSPCEGNV